MIEINDDNDDTCGGFNSDNDGDDDELLIDYNNNNNSDSSLSNDGNQSFSKNSNRKSINRRKQLKPNRISSMQLAALKKKKQKIEEQKEKVLMINEPEEGEVEEEDDEADSSNILKLNEKQTSNNSELDIVNSADSEAAYCNLCKKGFCNKYFLKSHMSNKHGGLFEPTSTVYLGSTGSTITHFKYTSSPPKKQQQQVQQDNQFTQDKFKLNEQPTSPLPSKQNQENDNLKFNGQDTTLQTLLTEDYCDSCQKHFCNKYYLRVNILFLFLFSSLYIFS